MNLRIVFVALASLSLAACASQPSSTNPPHPRPTEEHLP